MFFNVLYIFSISIDFIVSIALLSFAKPGGLGEAGLKPCHTLGALARGRRSGRRAALIGTAGGWCRRGRRQRALAPLPLLFSNFWWLLEVSQDVISVQTLQDIARTSMLLEQEILVKVEEYGQSPLFLAAVEGHLEAIQVRFGWTTDGIWVGWMGSPWIEQIGRTPGDFPCFYSDFFGMGWSPSMTTI